MAELFYAIKMGLLGLYLGNSRALILFLPALLGLLLALLTLRRRYGPIKIVAAISFSHLPAFCLLFQRNLECHDRAKISLPERRGNLWRAWFFRLQQVLTELLSLLRGKKWDWVILIFKKFTSNIYSQHWHCRSTLGHTEERKIRKSNAKKLTSLALYERESRAGSVKQTRSNELVVYELDRLKLPGALFFRNDVLLPKTLRF
jgi:hypothetical protein